MSTIGFLTERIHSAKLAIAGKFREIKPTQGLRRKGLFSELRNEDHALQDIEDAISAMLADVQLMTVAEWRKQFAEENEGLKNEKGEEILIPKERWPEVFGKIHLLEDNDLVPGVGLFNIPTPSMRKKADTKKKRSVFTGAEKAELEKKGRRLLKLEPKMTRDKFAKKLEVSTGYTNGMSAWTNRPFQIKKETEKDSRAIGKREGFDKAMEHESIKNHNEEELSRLMRDQEIDASNDG